MIKEFEFYHGVVFSQIFHASKKTVSIRPYPTQDNASYVLNDKVGIYIKYSTKRLTPWRFSFQKRHQDEILEMRNHLEEVYLLLVCNDDGIVLVSFDELKSILNEIHEETEWVSVSRSRRQMYSVSGSDGDLEFKVGRNDFPTRLFSPTHTTPTGKFFSWLKR